MHFVRDNGVGLAGTLFPVFQGFHDEKECMGVGIGLPSSTGSSSVMAE
ncbi:hypothetical protein ASZ90_016858 [hydrocarbon metagenome]|uniref:Uncharacterized protein n=1 Tax=hydrocarbon metagenome TaxID=938273 RepID=A0A0W8EB72_9ZZZZ